MTKLFHNTANSNKSEVHEGIKKNYNQNEAILKYMKYFNDVSFSAWDLHSAFELRLSTENEWLNPYTDKPILITSIRRALNSLERSGQICKVGTAKGKMKMSNTLYKYVTDTPLLCKSIPKQIKRTPEHGC